MRPLLSIVIANYNYGLFLEEAIRSVLVQKCPDVELLVVDGGSSDNSVEIIRRYSDDLAWWVSEKDRGQSNAFNKGFAHANGKYLTWLNADDVMPRGCLETITAEMRRYPDCEWFTGNFFRYFPGGKVMRIEWGPNFYPGWLQRKNGPVVAFGPSTFFSRKIFEKVGGVDERLHYAMDPALWIKFMALGVKQRRIRCFCWGFRMHEQSKTAVYEGRKRSDEVSCRIKNEFQMVARETGYLMSPVWHYLVNLWRLIDGSFAVKIYLTLFFRQYKGTRAYV